MVNIVSESTFYIHMCTNYFLLALHGLFNLIFNKCSTVDNISGFASCSYFLFYVFFTCVFTYTWVLITFYWLNTDLLILFSINVSPLITLADLLHVLTFYFMHFWDVFLHTHICTNYFLLTLHGLLNFIFNKCSPVDSISGFTSCSYFLFYMFYIHMCTNYFLLISHGPF